jgi:hypothetical protein
MDGQRAPVGKGKFEFSPFKPVIVKQQNLPHHTGLCSLWKP